MSKLRGEVLHSKVDHEEDYHPFERDQPKSPGTGRKVLNWLLTSTIFPSTYTVVEGIDDNGQIQPMDDKHKVLYQGFAEFFREHLLRAFGFDGYNHSTRMITGADGTTINIDKVNFPYGWLLASFFGLPSRPASVNDLKFTLLQLGRDAIGGWTQVKETITGDALLVDGTAELKGFGTDSRLDDQTLYTQKSFSQWRWTEKKIFLSVVLLFKFAFIGLFKLVTFPFKFLLNVVKLATEFLLPVVSYLTAAINYLMVKKFNEWMGKIFPEGAKGRRRVSPFYFAILFIPTLVLGVLTLAVGIFQYATVLACRIALACTSPEKSARLAFDAGYRFPVYNKVVKAIMGGIGAVLSLALSAVVWTIMLPLALSTLTTVFPALVNAINWVAQLPYVSSVVSTSTALLSGFFKAVGGALTLAFGPAVTALAGVIGVQVSATVMAVGTTLGLIVTPTAAILSRVADTLSSLWTKWVEQRPMHTLFARRPKVEAKLEPEADNSKLSVEDILNDDVPLLAEPTKEPKKEIVAPKQVYVYQKPSGDYVVSSKAVMIPEKVKAAEEEVDVALKYLSGILLKAADAEKLYVRAAKNVDKSSTQRATLDADEKPNYRTVTVME